MTPRARPARRGAEGFARPDPLPLFGHEQARERVRSELARGTLPRVLLVSGPRGIGKESFAFWVARLLLCEGPDPRPCGACPSCRKIAHLEHPDVHWFFPVPAESAFDEGDWIRLLEAIRGDPLDPSLTEFQQPASFRMHQAKTLRRLAATKSFQGGEQVFVLGNYEQNPSDQVHNALLKLLEEPPARTTFVLTTSRMQGLPPTILSRCRPLRLRPLGPDEMASFVALAAERHGRLDEAARRDLVARSEGRPGRALRLLGREEDAAEEAVTLLRAALEGGPLASYGWSMRHTFRGTREEHNRRLDVVGALWRDLLRLKAGLGGPLSRPDLVELYRQAVDRLDAPRAAEAALEIERARERIQANVYAPLVFWSLFRALAISFEPRARRVRAAYSTP